MAYDVYTLKGYVLKVQEYGEYDKRFIFLSEEKGLIEVIAISAMKSISKLRGFITRFCYIEINVVHGKRGYRLTRAKISGRGFLVHSKEAYYLLARFSELVLSILPLGASSIETNQIFDEITIFLENNIITDTDSNNLYYKYALKLLNEMGYRDSNLALPDSSLEQKQELQDILSLNGIKNML